MTGRFSVPGGAVDDEPTLELPVVVVRTAPTGSPPRVDAGAAGPAPWSPTARPRPGAVVGRFDDWLEDVTSRAGSWRGAGRARVAASGRAVVAGLGALVVWALGTALHLAAWALRVVRRVAPVALVVAVLVVGVRSLPWEAAGRLVRSVSGAGSSEPVDPTPTSSPESEDIVATSPRPTYPAMVPYGAVPDSYPSTNSVEVVRPGLGDD